MASVFSRVSLWLGGLVVGVTAFAGEWVAGPMLGYRAHREVAIWAETRNAATVTVHFHPVDRPSDARTLTMTTPAATPVGVQPMLFRLPLLEMGTRYTYWFEVDGQTIERPYPLTFETMNQWEYRTPPPDFTFLFGTCAYQNDAPYDRPGEPYGKGTDIFRHMAGSGADFMIWGGDNVYLREADFSSASGIWYRYSRDRANEDLQPLLAGMHHYAVWDDHDFGPNDSNRTFEFKDVSLQAFQTYWANPTWGEPDNPGVYGKFTWGDAIFLLLDDRYHRDESTLNEEGAEEKSVWGRQQFTWLKQSLLHAKRQRHYAWKFIVTGGQFVQTEDTSHRIETHELYRRERDELIEFIRENMITGVVFLTGDVHHSALYRRSITDTQALYEVTSSPISSGADTRGAEVKLRDPALVAGTYVATQNYCRLSLRGAPDARELLVQCFDSANTLRWERVVRLAELQ